ncbi:hypothetical protein KQI63_15080 [bacterium]|nr:hypothetical protein [bacterium]
MQRVRFTLTALMMVLMVAFLFVACTEDPTTPGGGGGENPTPNDGEVAIVALTVGRTSIANYYGETDSISVTAVAKRSDNTTVEEATIEFTLTGPGSMSLPNENVTDENGEVTGKFVITSLLDTSTVISAVCNGITVNRTVAISVEDVRVSMTATPATQEVVTGEQGQAELKIRIQDNLGVAVSGVPIRLQLLNGTGTLSLPEYSTTDNAYLSTLTVDAVDEAVETQVRAFVNPGGEITYIGGGGNGKMASSNDDGNGEEPPAAPVRQSKGKGNRQIAASVTSDTIIVSMTPSNSRVSSIFVNADPNRMVVAPGESQQSTVTLVAYDENNNGVGQLQLYVRVRNILDGQVAGSISTPVLTDDTGMTTATLSTNLRYGTWTIEASSGPTFNSVFVDTVEVVTGSAQQLQMAADTTRIAVFGTNGISTTQLRAMVTDQNGNAVEDGKKVFFLLTQFQYQNTDEARIIVGESDGTDSPYDDPLHPGSGYGLPFDSTVTNGGEAAITLTAGSRKGGMRLKAWTYLDAARTDSVVANYDGVAVVAGPPEYVEVDNRGEAEDGGGAVWLLEVSARVQDSMNNDVADGYQVIFTLDNEDAHIGDGFTGNIGPITDNPERGVAFTGLAYHSRLTNQVVNVSAQVIRGSDGLLATDTYTLKLPIQRAVGVMNVSPSNFHFDQHVPNPGYAQILVTIYVYDGHQHLINDQEIHYSPQFGRMYDTATLLPQNPQRPYALTGPADYQSEVPDDDPEGVCKRYLLITQVEAFPDPTAPINTCTINAEIVGVEDANIEPFTVFLYQGGGTE